MENTEKDYSRKWFVMAAISMGTLLATIDGSIVNVALPTLVRELNTDFPTVQWVVLAYLLTLAVLLLSVGRLGDMIGKKGVYTVGFAIFTLGSFLCGLASNVYLLILFRVVQAVGATMIMALGAAIVTEAFPPQERGKALGITGTTVSVGIVIGPTLGGLILDLLSWNWIFYVNIPVGILGIMMVIRFVPDIKPVGAQRFDFLGAITLFISLLALLSALTIGQNIGFTNHRTIALFIIWAVFLAIFIFIEKRAKQPMIDLTLFRDELFSINLVTGFITFISIAGMFILMPFFLENILQYSTRQVGLLIAAVPITMGVIAPIAGSLSDRFGSRIITFIGLSILLFGYSFMTSLSEQTSTISFILLLVPIGLGMGVFQSPNNSAIMGTAPRDKLGVVSGMLSLTRVLGQSTGIAIIGAIWAAFTLKYSESTTITSATEAPAIAQVSALQNTLIFIASIIFIGLVLALWALIKERQMSATTPKLEEELTISD
jgi:EmrB/QacA subfamily drug resistance transporter